MHFYSPQNIQKLEQYLGTRKKPGEYEQILWEKVSQYNTYFAKVPGILGIAVCNSLAMNSCHENSDIDLFIITKKNRLWTTRICMTLLLTVLGQRKTRSKHKGKFCLSFFVTQDGLNLETIALENDIYLSYWIDTLKPIINRQNIFESFIEENQALIQFSPKRRNEATKAKHNMQPSSPFGRGDSEVRDKKSEHSLGKPRKFSTSFGDYCEKLLKFIFLPRTKKSFQKLGKPFGVVISDTMLKFHDKDRRKEIRNIISS